MNRLQTIFPFMKAAVKAKIVGHTVVATFRTSNPPTVWRMDLEKNHSFALAIQKGAGDWELGVMSPKGEFTAVARFDDRREVDHALAAVEAAMFSNPNGTGAKVWRVSAMAAAILAVFIVGGALLGWMQTGGQDTAPMPPQAAGPINKPAAVRSGVPMDADAVLGK